MVTVIANKEEIPTPVNNGVTAESNDNERSCQDMRDYVEVDFHRSSSCKPLPEDLIELTNGQITKSSINGTFFVQIDSFELITNFNTNNQLEQTNDYKSFLLTITDGITTVKSITIDSIPKLSFNIRPGCKLLLNGIISIKDGLLQLTHQNTRFQYGSNKYARPRSAYRGRVGGSHRPSYEGRRGGAGNSNSRHDNDDSGSNFLRGIPPKSTLKDFMTPLNISNDTKQTSDIQNQNLKDQHDKKRRNNEHHYQTNKSNNNNATNLLATSDANYHQQSIILHYTDQVTFEQEENYDQLDPDDDSSHSMHRERRNPLPPRLQRAQEERTRRNTNRYYDEFISLSGNELNGNYHNGIINNNGLSSSSVYPQHGDPMSYIAHNSSTGQIHPSLNTYASHANMLASGLGSTPTHLTYFSTNAGHLAYGLTGIASPPFHSQQPSMVPGYTNDRLEFCCTGPFINSTYLSSTVANGSNEDLKTSINSSALQTNSLHDDNETKITNNESQQDESNKNEDKSQISSVDQKKTLSSASSTISSSSNDANNTSQQVHTEQQEEKRRDSNSNPRVRWKVGDTCLARWSEDNEYYVADIVEIQAPHCIVQFRDYNNYDKLRFSDLKLLTCDQQYYQFVPPIAATAPPPPPPPLLSDMNVLGANICYPPRTNYYPSVIDDYIIMPEAPPFPFNSAGTLYMCPPTFTSMPRSARFTPNGIPLYQQNNRRTENGNIIHNNVHVTINSSSTESKDSNDTSMIDSTTISVDDNHQFQQQDILISTKGIRQCSIADAPIKLVTHDGERDRSTSTESVTSSKCDDQQTNVQEEKQENKCVVSC